MTDLFLDEKVLNYEGDKYELVLLTMRWARTLKAKGSPEPMQVLVERALKEIVEGKVQPDQIIQEAAANPLAPAASALDNFDGEIPNKEALAQAFAEEEEEERKKAKKKSKK